MGTLELALLIIGLVILIVIVPLIWFILTNNAFKRLQKEINEAKIVLNTSIMTFYEVFIRTFNECVKKHHLDDDLVNSIKSIKGPNLNDGFEEKQKFVYQLFELIKVTVNEVNEKTLIKNSQEFNECLRRTNEEIEALYAARRVYNASVSYFNQKRITFPHKIVGKLRGFTNYPFFETELP